MYTAREINGQPGRTWVIGSRHYITDNFFNLQEQQDMQVIRSILGLLALSDLFIINFLPSSYYLGFTHCSYSM